MSQQSDLKRSSDDAGEKMLIFTKLANIWSKTTVSGQFALCGVFAAHASATTTYLNMY